MKTITDILWWFVAPWVRWAKEYNYKMNHSKVHFKSGLRVHKDGFVIDRSTYYSGNYSVVYARNKKWHIHILVADCFIPNPDNLPVVNHIDGNSYNNRLENLERTTYSENTRHAYRIGLAKIKLTYEQAQEIKRSTESNDILSKKYKVAPSHIRNIKNGYCWNH